MMMNRTVSACLALCAAPLLAHDLYLMPERFRLEPGGAAVVYIHNGDEFPESGGPPVLARLREVKRVDAQGSAPLRDLRNEEKRGRAAFEAVPGWFVLTAQTVPNFLTLPPDKFDEYLKHEHLDWVIAWRKEHGEAAVPSRELYSKYAKSLVRGGERAGIATRPLGLAIEIVPAVEPSRLKSGSALPVRVLFQGKPAKNLPVEAMCAAGGKLVSEAWATTDAEGQVSVPVRTGVCKLHAIQMLRSSVRTRADWESYWASLTFELP